MPLQLLEFAQPQKELRQLGHHRSRHGPRVDAQIAVAVALQRFKRDTDIALRALGVLDPDHSIHGLSALKKLLS
jgi:hypothetical protein